MVLIWRNEGTVEAEELVSNVVCRCIGKATCTDTVLMYKSS